jgi:hypothetical protein
MKYITIIASVFLMLAGVSFANGVSDIEVIVSPGSNASVTATAQGVNGWVNSVAIDTASGSSGNVTVAIQPSQTTMDSRTIVVTNDVAADLWLDPSDGASRRYAVTDMDKFSVTASNLTVAAKTYRVVIRVESAK